MLGERSIGKWYLDNKSRIVLLDEDYNMVGFVDTINVFKNGVKEE